MPPLPLPASRCVVEGAGDAQAVPLTLPEASVCRHWLIILGNTSLAVPIKLRFPAGPTLKPAPLPLASTRKGDAAEPARVVIRNKFPVPVEAADSPILNAAKVEPL